MGSGEFGRDTTTSEVLDGVDLSGRLAVVTGASGGLGAHTASALAERGARVILASRDGAKTESVAASIRAAAGPDAATAMVLDLTSQASIRDFAQRFLSDHDRLDLLINNAGIMACPLGRSPEGWELQFATNHMGHFLLTMRLAPALLKAAPARVVCLSSAAHMFSPVVFDDVQFENRPYDKWSAYGQSKTANALFALELDRRLAPRGVHAYSVHPGMIMTELARSLTPEDIKGLMDDSGGRSAPAFKSVEAGAATSVFAATSPSLADWGGAYLEDCGVARPPGEVEGAIGVLPHAQDPEAAARLWALSERLLGEPFDL